MSEVLTQRDASAGGVRSLLANLNGGGRLQDMALALLAVAVISLMVLPMPPMMLDALIAFNIAISVLLLMSSMYVRSPLALSTFPTLLLFTTLLRLSLNIASTRAILLHAHAGDIIQTFGKLVVGGNVVVGIVVFLIIAIVQFIVIAKGAERVAEVGARFTLDALPGKQMSIDAELRAGILDKSEAREKRNLLQRESQLYGAMDGAMKFVKGDAIAGLLIALVNMIAGVGIGVGMIGMSLADAASTYSILTVGDGLVSQIPSLFVSLAAGVLITRVSNDEDEDSKSGSGLSSDIARQVASHPKALLVTAVVLALFMMVPGFPKLQFLVVALLFGGIAWGLRKKLTERERYDPMSSDHVHRDGIARPRLAADLEQELVNSYAITLKLSSSVSPLLRNGSLDDEVQRAKRLVTRRLGIPFPGIGVTISEDLPPDHYLVMLNEIPSMSGDVMPGKVYAFAGADQLSAAGVTLELADGDDGAKDATGATGATAAKGAMESTTRAAGSGVWVDPEDITRLDEASIDYMSDARVIGQTLVRVMTRNAGSFVGLQEVRQLLSEAEKVFPDLVSEASRVVPMARMTEVLRRLVEEDVSLRNMRDILQALIEWAPREKDVILLTEYVRNALGPQITFQFGGVSRSIRAIVMTRAVEDEMRAAVQVTNAGNFMALPPEKAAHFSDRIVELARDARQQGGPPVVVLASMDIRRYVKRMLEARAPMLPVVSYQDLTADARVQAVGRLEE